MTGFGRIVHVKALARELPAIVTDVLDDGSLNLVVFTDGLNEPGDPAVHMVNVSEGMEVGNWHRWEDCDSSQ